MGEEDRKWERRNKKQEKRDRKWERMGRVVGEEGTGSGRGGDRKLERRRQKVGEEGA